MRTSILAQTPKEVSLFLLQALIIFKLPDREVKVWIENYDYFFSTKELRSPTSATVASR